MTLEDKQRGVMAGSRGTDDVNRTPNQNRKKRPLSAVFESEFEADSEVFVDDPALKDSLPHRHTANAEDSVDAHGKNPSAESDSINNNNSNALKHSPRETSQRSRLTSSHGGIDGSAGDTLKERRAPSKSRSSRSPSPNCASLVSSLRAIFETGPKNTTGLARSPENRPQTSPKLPSRGKFAAAKASRRSPSASPQISRRSSSVLYSSSSDVSDDEITPTASDMARLRQMAERLCLSTRRASVQQWRARYVDSHELPVLWSSGNGDVSGGGQNGDEGGKWTAERTERINMALDWIKTELQAMRTQDQQLARQLLTIRSDLHRLKLARSCEEHRDMLDDVQFELEELQEFADVLDLPTPTLTDSPLKHLGVTRMNFSARRFSTC